MSCSTDAAPEKAAHLCGARGCVRYAACAPERLVLVRNVVAVSGRGGSGPDPGRCHAWGGRVARVVAAVFLSPIGPAGGLIRAVVVCVAVLNGDIGDVVCDGRFVVW